MARMGKVKQTTVGDENYFVLCVRYKLGLAIFCSGFQCYFTTMRPAYSISSNGSTSNLLQGKSLIEMETETFGFTLLFLYNY